MAFSNEMVFSIQAAKFIGKNQAYNRNKGRSNPGEIGSDELVDIFEHEICNETLFEMCALPRCRDSSGRTAAHLLPTYSDMAQNLGTMARNTFSLDCCCTEPKPA